MANLTKVNAFWFTKFAFFSQSRVLVIAQRRTMLLIKIYQEMNMEKTVRKIEELRKIIVESKTRLKLMKKLWVNAVEIELSELQTGWLNFSDDYEMTMS